jgi:hypothetical protein
VYQGAAENWFFFTNVNFRISSANDSSQCGRPSGRSTYRDPACRSITSSSPGSAAVATCQLWHTVGAEQGTACRGEDCWELTHKHNMCQPKCWLYRMPFLRAVREQILRTGTKKRNRRFRGTIVIPVVCQNWQRTSMVRNVVLCQRISSLVL